MSSENQEAVGDMHDLVLVIISHQSHISNHTGSGCKVGMTI